MYINIKKLKEDASFINRDQLFSGDFSGLEIMVYALIFDDLELFQKAHQSFKNSISFRKELDFSQETKSFNILHLAILMENIPFVHAILDIDGSLVNARTANKMTTLMIACLKGNYEIVHIMLSKGCRINDTNHSRNTALHLAVYSKNIDIIKYLVKHKCDLNVKNTDGVTPLMMSVIRDIEIAKYLIHVGADLNIVSRKTSKNVGTNALGQLLRNMKTENINLLNLSKLMLNKGCNRKELIFAGVSIEDYVKNSNLTKLKKIFEEFEPNYIIKPNYDNIFTNELLTKINDFIQEDISLEDKILKVLEVGLKKNEKKGSVEDVKL